MAVALGVFFAVLAALGLTGQALAVRVATRRGRSADVLLVVLLVNTVVLVPAAFASTPDPTVTVTSIVAFAAAGIMGTMFGRAFFYAGIKRIGASRAEPVKASMPLHATVLSVLVLGESVTVLQFGGILVIIVGIALVTWEGAAGSRAVPQDAAWTGLALPFAAAVFFGLEPIFASIGFEEGTPVLVGLAIKFVAALAVFLVYLASNGSLSGLGRFRDADMRWYLFAGVSSTGFSLAYYAGLDVSTVGIVVPIMQCSPLLVVLFSAAFLGDVERVTAKVVTAAGVIVVGGVLVTLG